MSESLAAAAKGKTARFSVDTGHNDFFANGGKTVWDALSAFIHGQK
jgi:hypothetical protein